MPRNCGIYEVDEADLALRLDEVISNALPSFFCNTAIRAAGNDSTDGDTLKRTAMHGDRDLEAHAMRTQANLAQKRGERR